MFNNFSIHYICEYKNQLKTEKILDRIPRKQITRPEIRIVLLGRTSAGHVGLACGVFDCV